MDREALRQWARVGDADLSGLQAEEDARRAAEREVGNVDLSVFGIQVDAQFNPANNTKGKATLRQVRDTPRELKPAEVTQLQKRLIRAGYFDRIAGDFDGYDEGDAYDEATQAASGTGHLRRCA